METKLCRDNILNGNIWFASANTNRFTNNDIFEARNSLGEYLFEYSLSLSEEPKKDKFNIQITDLNEYLRAIFSSIQNQELNHQVTWHNPAILNETIASRMKSHSYNAWPAPLSSSHKLDTAYFSALELGARKLEYHNKIIKPQKKFSSIEIAKNTYDANIDYTRETELRIYLRGNFVGKDSDSLHAYVEYLKLTCPQTKNYCVSY